MEEMLASDPSVGTFRDEFLQKGEKCVQLDCQSVLKEELKNIWAQAVLSDNRLFDQPSFKDRALRSLRSPFSRSCPLSEVLRFLVSKQMGCLTPPLVPQYAALPLFELCQLAFLWSIAGFYLEASSLAHSIFSFCDFPYLWLREEEYNESEVLLSVSFFRSGTLSPLQSTPFLSAISKLFTGFDVPCSITPFSPEPLFFHSTDSRGVLTLQGRRTSLGTFYVQDIEVRAFGPQINPLSEPKGFGIERSLPGQDHWTNSSALPEVWLNVNQFFENGLDIRFLGLTVDTPINFSLYVKAPNVKIGTLQFMPKSLTRYQGESKPVIFGDKLQIQSLLPGRMELIPLAGEGCFWGAEFLLSFEIYPLDARCLLQWNHVGYGST